MILAAFRDWFDWFPLEAAGTTIKWIIVGVLLIVGFVGTFVPIIPGTTLIWVGMLVHYFSMGMEQSGLAWQGLVFVTLLYVLTLIIDWVSGALGAKWFGSSKWGIIGAIVGGIIGLFFSLPGLILGPILGVFIFELTFAKKQVKEAGNSTVGTVIGGIAGLIGRVILAIGMLLWYVGDVFLVN